MIDATAEDDDVITSVCFYANGLLLGSDTTNPYQCSWNGAPPGDHAVKTVAWDNDGNSVTSDIVNLTVSLHPIPYVMVISVDGMGSEYVKSLLTEGLLND